MSVWCKEHGVTHDCAICLTAEVEKDERAKCAAEHYTREDMVRALVQLQIDNDELRQEPGRHLASYRAALVSACEAIADRLLAEREKPKKGWGPKDLGWPTKEHLEPEEKP